MELPLATPCVTSELRCCATLQSFTLLPTTASSVAPGLSRSMLPSGPAAAKRVALIFGAPSLKPQESCTMHGRPSGYPSVAISRNDQATRQHARW